MKERLGWFPDKEEAIALAEKVARQYGCNAQGWLGVWQRYNVIEPEVGVIVFAANQAGPNSPAGYEVILEH
ncbi:MAG: hypothetical protein K6U04_12845 [Armatimonadetes bacterium]|nr:hypothetical protein [Armatimonadota bacterium]